MFYEILFGFEPNENFFAEGHQGSVFIKHLQTIAEFTSDGEAWTGLSIILPSYWIKRRRYRQSVRILSEMVEERKRELIANCTDYAKRPEDIDIFPKILEACEKGVLTSRSAVIETIMLFVAGQATSAVAMTIMLYFIAIHQDLQDKIRLEIENVIHSGMFPESQSDLIKFRLLRATLNETLRLAPPFIFSFAHCCNINSKIGPNGEIPEGSVFNLFLPPMLRDPKYFENPNNFDPHRWMTDDDVLLSHMNKAFKPFGLGSTMCPGRSLAQAEILSLSASLLMHYRVHLSSEVKFKRGMEPFLEIQGFGPDPSEVLLEFTKID